MHAAVDVQRAAGDVVRARRREKDDRVGDIFYPAEAREWNLIEYAFALLV